VSGETAQNVAGLVVGLGVLAFLVVALVFPERF
jgi:K+-transporting ATPase KdpF subunit